MSWCVFKFNQKTKFLIVTIINEQPNHSFDCMKHQCPCWLIWCYIQSIFLLVLNWLGLSVSVNNVRIFIKSDACSTGTIINAFLLQLVVGFLNFVINSVLCDLYWRRNVLLSKELKSVVFYLNLETKNRPSASVWIFLFSLVKQKTCNS